MVCSIIVPYAFIVSAQLLEATLCGSSQHAQYLDPTTLQPVYFTP